MGGAVCKNGSLFIGTTGIATCGTYSGNSRLLPASRVAEYTKPTLSIPRVKREDLYIEWTDAIKNDTQPGSQFAYACPLTEMANFGNIAIRAGKKIDWDSRAFKITNDEAASAMFTKEYRKGWELPC